MPKPLRIFISSPGDVASERRRAALVVESLKKEFARFFEITAYLWEHEAMLATGHFQDVIEPPSQSDIVVLILWSRLGTPLPEKSGKREYRGIDGRAPVTGTEWEYEDALAANRSKGAPDLLVYRSNKEPQISLRDPTKKAMAEGQWQALENFWSRYFQAGGVFLSAFHGFDDLEDFGDMLEAHLRQLIRARIEKGRIEAGAETKATWMQSPFRGLSSYDFEHAPIFFGRGAAQLKAVEQVVKNANEGRAFLLVLGASGSGKSSLVRAGLLPNLFARGVADGAGMWRRVAMKPADANGNLFHGLARALAEDRVREGIGLPEILGPGVTVEQLENALRRSVDDPAFVFQPALGRITAEARASGRIMGHESAKLALVFDQFEEIFTDTAISTEERNTFIRLIGALSRTGAVWVVATMRSDFWHKAAAAPELVELAEGLGRMDLLPPSQAELAEMIRRPAAAAGLSFEDHAETRIGLDAVIAEEASRDPGSLPLVSFMLDALYKSDVEGTKGSVLTYDTYESLGGIKGAIAKRADEILAAQSPDVQAAFPSVLRALVTVDSDRDQGATARVTPLSAFPAGSPRRALVDAFLDPQARLLIADGDGGEARVRVAHEALINHWTRARDQITRDRRDLETRARLEEDELLWRAAPPGEKAARLLEGLALEEGKDLAAKWGDELPPSLKEYIEESNKAATRRRRRSFRILTTVAAVMAVLAIASGVAGIYAINYAGIADENAVKAQAAADEANLARGATAQQLKETRRGTARLIERQAYTASKQGYPELALALAVESVRVGQETGDLPRASLAALQHAASTDTIASVLSATGSSLNDVAFGAESATLITLRSDGYLTLWNGTDGTDISSFGSPPDYSAIKGVTDWNGTYFVAAYTNGQVQVYNYSDLTAVGGATTMDSPPSALDIDHQARMVAVGDESGNVRFFSPGDQSILLNEAAHTGKVTDIEIAENLSIAVSASLDGLAAVWDLQTMTKRTTVAHGSTELPLKVTEVVISPSGDQFVLIGDGIGSVFSADGTKVGEFNFSDRFVYKVAYTPDGQFLLYAAGKDVTIVPTGAVTGPGRTLSGHTFDVRGLDVSEDGTRVLTYSGDNTLRLWDFASGSTLRLFRSPKGSISAQALSRDGNFVSAVFDDGNAVVWTVEGLAPLSARRVHTWNINSLEWSKDGSQILTSAGDGTAMISESELSFPIFSLSVAPATSVYNALYTPDGTQIVTADSERAVRLWDAATGDAVKTITTLENDYYPYWVCISPDGKNVLVSTFGSVRVVEIASGTEVRRMNAPGIPLYTMAMSPDGKRVAAGADDGRLFIWDYETAEPIAELREHRSTINSVNFSPDSKRVVTGASDRTVRLWNAETGAVELLLSHDDIVLSVAFSPDGQRIVSSSFDATVRLWDAVTGAELANFVGPGRPFRAALFSPDQKRIAAVGDDQRLYLWDISGKNGANTATAAPILSSELNANDGKLMKEMIAWAPLTVSKPLSPSERRANYLEADPGVRRFDSNPDACDTLAAYQSDPQRRAPGAQEGQLNVVDALKYCKAAVDASPGELRFHLQYGRALIANEQREEGLKEVQVAIDAGYPGAIYYLALYLIDPLNGTTEDLKKGMDLAVKSRDLGVPDAGDLIARQTLDGLKSKEGVEIVKQDRQAAVKLYEEAARKGSWFASINLAFLYEYDQKDEAGNVWLKQDKAEALYYFALAARQVEVEGFVESTEARRASFLFAHRASIARSLVRNGQSEQVAKVAQRLADWEASANLAPNPLPTPAAEPGAEGTPAQ